MNNDEFKIDTVTGNVTVSHQMNVLYMQPDSFKEESNVDSTTTQNATKKEVSKELNVMCKELTNKQQFVCPPGAGTKPTVWGNHSLS